MATFRNLLLSVVAVPALVLAQRSNIDLFSFVMADAQLIAGAHVDAAKNSPFGQFVLARMPVSGMFLNTVVSEAGIDPRSDLSEILVAWNGATNADARWMAAAHGKLSASVETIEVNAMKNGATLTRLPGVDLLNISGPRGSGPQVINLCIALYTDGFTDLAGDCTTVNTAIEFWSTTGGPASPVGLKAQQLRAQQDLWFASVVPLSELANFAPGGSGTGGAPASGPGMILNNSLFKAIQEISGGVKFGSTAQPGAQLSAELTMDSPQDANSLLNVLNFLVGLIQNSGTPPGSGLAALLSNLQASVNGNALDIALNIPEATLEQLFEQVAQVATGQVAAR